MVLVRMPDGSIHVMEVKGDGTIAGLDLSKGWISGDKDLKTTTVVNFFPRLLGGGANCSRCGGDTALDPDAMEAKLRSKEAELVVMSQELERATERLRKLETAANDSKLKFQREKEEAIDLAVRETEEEVDIEWEEYVDSLKSQFEKQLQETLRLEESHRLLAAKLNGTKGLIYNNGDLLSNADLPLPEALGVIRRALEYLQKHPGQAYTGNYNANFDDNNNNNNNSNNNSNSPYKNAWTPRGDVVSAILAGPDAAAVKNYFCNLSPPENPRHGIVRELRRFERSQSRSGGGKSNQRNGTAQYVQTWLDSAPQSHDVVFYRLHPRIAKRAWLE